MRPEDTNVIRRKKVCSKCREEKGIEDFYKNRYALDGLTCCCKECMKEMKRVEYARNRKIPDGVKFDKSGRKVMHKGRSTSIYWDGNMLAMLRRYFPNTLNDELAEILGVSKRTMIRKARELGLEKDPHWLKGVWDDLRIKAHSASKEKGYPGAFKKGRKFTGNQFTGKLEN